MTYIQANFCNSMVDMDIYWLQICAAHLPADQFVDMCIDVFGVREWLSMTPMTAAQAAEQDAMVEGLLTFLAILVSSRTNLGNDELTQSRLEVATLLAAGDKTHSQLLELMPERSGNAHTRNFETVLKELSVYRAPPKGSESLEQGLFVPTSAVWERHYDPLHVLRRAVHRRDFHASMDRFAAYVREKQKAEGGAAPAGPLWPPLRPALAPPDAAGDPRQLCASGVLHGALLAVLHRGVRRRYAEGEGDAEPAPPDHVLALAVYLLAVAADLAAERARTHTRDVCVAESFSGSSGARVSGVPLLRAFAGGSVCDNARTLLLSVPPPPRAADTRLHRSEPRAHHSDSEPEWEGGEGGESGAEAGASKASLPAASTALAVPLERQMVRGSSVSDDQSDTGGEMPDIRALESGSSDSRALVAQGDEDVDMDAQHLTLALPASAPDVHSPVELHYGE
ncbi:unnamed protein product [Euphydryas editha]|uniref:E3 ubiquitin-protein ligase n=1 Tax=Euphydryas editha TaxID=104508 RepID=A0AAU9UIB4_EUPED|nr:unnamed protein product [Euphydryas editha]